MSDRHALRDLAGDVRDERYGTGEVIDAEPEKLIYQVRSAAWPARPA